MGAYVEPMGQKDDVLNRAAADQYRGIYIPFGKIHWASFFLGGCARVVFSDDRVKETDDDPH